MDRKKVIEMARLSRLSISDDEAEKLAAEFSEVLEMFGKLDEIECDGFIVTPVEAEPELRDDTPSEALRRSQEIISPRTVE